ncbi:MAG: hypothetical protein RRB13_10495 [bacterium]|nr:hypothetical protein [bacterium]
MKPFISFLALFGLLLANLQAAVPHTLSNGQKVDATQLNENFAANAKRWVFKNNGVLLGDVIANGDFVSSQGYIGKIQRDSNYTGQPGGNKFSIFFSSTDCSGTKYNYTGYAGWVVLGSDGTSYYLKWNDQVTGLAYKSSRVLDGSCTSLPGNTTIYFMQPMYINDVTVTGVPNYPLSGPITLVKE